MTDGIPGFLDRRPLVATYTMLHCYEDICPHQAYRRYVKKDLPFVETDAMRWGNQVHTAMEQRVAGGKPLPLTMAQWEPFAAPFDGRSPKVEQKLALDITGKPCGYLDYSKVRFRVKVDLALVNGSTAYMLDWKTGNSKYENPFELAIGAMHLHALHPTLTTIVGQYAWLKEDRLGELHDLSETNRTWDRCNKLLSQMEVAKGAGYWPKIEGPLCAWCDVADCEFNKKPRLMPEAKAALG